MQQPETFYEIRRQIKTMLDLATQVHLAGYHHLPEHAKAMAIAYHKALAARDGNSPVQALKHLAAFWNIYNGYLDEEAEYRRHVSPLSLAAETA